MRVHMMDMGGRRYGDCTLVHVDGRTVLIDGGHKGDERSVEDGGTDLLGQIEAAIGQTAPLTVDLLVVTHAHADHVGCLPELVAGGLLRARWTLAIDEALSFGTVSASPATSVSRVVAAMREEPTPGEASDAEVGSAIDDAATLQERYRAMLATLASTGRLILLGRDSPFVLEQEFASIGLKVVGPTVEQLLLCAQAIDHAREVASRRVAHAASRDAAADEVSLYRAVAGSATDGDSEADGSGSAAVNCQSVVLRLRDGGASAVFLGDMQFASPQVGGLRAHVEELLLALRSAGPFDFARLPHHGAANGTDARLIDAIGPDAVYGVSGGVSGAHPARSVLDLLAGSKSAGWTRTDANGAVAWTAGAENPWTVTRGQVADSTPPVATSRSRRSKGAPAVSAARPAVAVRGPLGAGRPLPHLLFATNSAALARRVGASAADEALELVRAEGQQLLDILDSSAALQMIRGAATGCDGVVLLGGHDVLPLLALDALPASIRKSLSRGDGDPDNHFIWSDDPYVSFDGGAPDLPVSRIPDGGDGELLLSALRTRAVPSDRAFGLRNAERPFAERLFEPLGRGMQMQVAEPSRSGGYGSMISGHVYVMLHCSHDDCGRYWGSDDREDAFVTSDVPTDFAGSVFAGCCYGALTVDRPALDDAADIEALTSDSSVALRFLRAGAVGFVGSTGVHYSPVAPPWSGAAGRLHEAFLRSIAAGVAPARALFDAKIDYIKSLRTDVEPGESAIAFKTWRQFSCLGLGW